MRWALVLALSCAGCGIGAARRVALENRVRALGEGLARVADTPAQALAARAETAALVSDLDDALSGR